MEILVALLRILNVGPTDTSSKNENLGILINRRTLDAENEISQIDVAVSARLRTAQAAYRYPTKPSPLSVVVGTVEAHPTFQGG
jgi:hypothetical protein